MGLRVTAPQSRRNLVCLALRPPDLVIVMVDDVWRLQATMSTYNTGPGTREFHVTDVINRGVLEIFFISSYAPEVADSTDPGHI